jgi:hypothetical protein
MIYNGPVPNQVVCLPRGIEISVSHSGITKKKLLEITMFNITIYIKTHHF